MNSDLKKKLFATIIFIFFLTVTVFVLSYVSINFKNIKENEKLQLKTEVLTLSRQIDHLNLTLALYDRNGKYYQEAQNRLKNLLQEKNLKNYMIFDKWANVLLENGDISLPENFKPHSEVKDREIFWQSITNNIGKIHYYLKILDTNQGRLYMPVSSNKNTSNLLIYIKLGEGFFRIIPKGQDPNFLLKLFLGVILILLANTSAIFILYTFLVKPVQTIKSSMEKFNQGDLDIRISYKLTGGVFGQLAEQFDTIVEEYSRIHEDNRQLALDQTNYESMFESQSFLISELQNQMKRDIENAVFNGFEICQKQNLHGSFSGELVDIAKRPNGNLLFFAVNATGQSVSAALLTITLSKWFREMAQSNANTNNVFKDIKNRASRITGAIDYFSCILISSSATSNKIEYINAGFPPPVVIKKSGGILLLEQVISPITVSGSAELGEYELSGSTDDSQIKSTSIDLEVGDHLILYTKGFIKHLQKGPKESSLELGQAMTTLPRSDSLSRLTDQLFKKFSTGKDYLTNELSDRTLLVIRKAKMSESAPEIMQRDLSEYEDISFNEPGEVSLDQGKELYNNKNFHRALPVFEDYLDRNPDDPEALLYYSDTLLHLDENEKALENYQRLTSIVGEDPDIEFKVGLIYYRLSNLGDAAQRMQKAIDLKTTYGDAWLYAGVSFANQGNFDQALNVLERAKHEGVYQDEAQRLIEQINELKNSA